MPVLRVYVNGKLLDLTKHPQPEHDKNRPQLYIEPRRNTRWAKPFGQPRRAKIFTKEEIKAFARANQKRIDRIFEERMAL